MSASRHLVNLFAYESPLLAREAVKTSLIKSQGAMNFLFVRIYKSANVEYLENKVKENFKVFKKWIKNCESALTSSSQYYLYLLKKEEFRKALRKLFMPASVIDSISNYYNWKRSYDAGLATACLIYYNYEEENSFWGKPINAPLVHKYEVIDKLCNISDMSITHTSLTDWHSSCASNFDPLDLIKKDEEGEDSEVEDISRFSRSVSVPNVQKLEVELQENLSTKTMYSGPKSITSSELKFGGKSIDLTNTVMFSVDSENDQFY